MGTEFLGVSKASWKRAVKAKKGPNRKPGPSKF
jgi:hypothetical protein